MLEIEKILQKIEVRKEENDKHSARYIIEPLYRGYGNTLGNSIRRVLLSSTPGAAVKAIKIDGVLSEFSAIDGVKEPVTDIILNVKDLVLKMDEAGERRMKLSVMGPKVVTGEDIELPVGTEIINPESVILTITEEKQIDMEFLVDTNFSFVVAEEMDKSGWEKGFIAIDAIYSPIRKVIYKVENTMVGRMTNFDKLIIDIETDGSINTDDILSYSVDILMKHFTPILDIGSKLEEYREELDEESIEAEETENVDEKDISSMKIDELDFTVRSYNCLKKAGIETLGALAKLTIQDLLKIKNLGRKSLTEIDEKLKEHGYDIKNINES